MHEKIRSLYPHICTRRCEEGNCKLDLGGVKPVLVLNFEEYCNEHAVRGERCDRIVFALPGTTAIVAVELKGGKNLEASRAPAQLQQAADQLPTILEAIEERNSPHRFYPLLVCARVKHANDLKVLRRHPVRYQGVKYPVICRRCGAQIRQVVQL